MFALSLLWLLFLLVLFCSFTMDKSSSPERDWQLVFMLSSISLLTGMNFISTVFWVLTLYGIFIYPFSEDFIDKEEEMSFNSSLVIILIMILRTLVSFF